MTSNDACGDVQIVDLFYYHVSVILLNTATATMVS